ncbi:MAG: O-antigen ligase family protein [Phycisphaerales bacterium]
MSTVLAILAAALVVLGMCVCVFKPRYALVPVLMLFPIEQILMGYIPELRWKYGGTVNIIIGLIAVFGVGYRFFSGQRLVEGMNNRVFWLLMLLYLYIALSALWSPSPDGAMYFIGQSWPYFCLFFLVTPLLVGRTEDFESVVVPFIFTGVMLMGLMLVNPNAKFINGRFAIDLGFVAGLGTVQSNPLAIADAGAMLAIVSAVYRPNNVRPVLTLLRWSGILLGLTLALLSGSRGQVLVGVAVIALLVPMVNKSRNVLRILGTFAMIAVVVGFLYFVYSTFLSQTGQSRWGSSGSDDGLSVRADMAMTALGAYMTSPVYWLTGLGASAFNAFYTNRPEGFSYLYPHNILVECLSEYGIPGVALMVALGWLTIKNFRILVQTSGDDRSKRTAVLAFGGMALFQFLIALKQGSLLGMPPVFMFALMAATVVRSEELVNGPVVLGQPREELYGEEEAAYAEEYGAPAPE